MNVSQLLVTSPDELVKEITKIISKEIQDLKSEFQPKEPTEFLTRTDVALLLKIDLSTLHNWTKSHKLTSYGLGGKIYYKREEIENSIVKIKR